MTVEDDERTSTGSDLGPVVAELDQRLADEEKHDHPQFARTDEVREIVRDELGKALAEREPEPEPEEETITVETPEDVEPEEEDEPEPRKPRSRRYGKGR